MMKNLCRALVCLFLALPSCSDENTSTQSTEQVHQPDAFTVIQEEPVADTEEDSPESDALQLSLIHI